MKTPSPLFPFSVTVVLSMAFSGLARASDEGVHWAFAPLTQSPAGQETTRIDDIIHSGLADVGLRPGAVAGRPVLLRRLYFHLTGLPPTEEEVAAFASDESPLAVEEVVDRLLESPRFGERWGRHWLDLARYADSNGLDENFLFREAWRYRNWVIGAVNADMPFDRFLLEQVAGDLLPYETLEQRDRQRIAAGFLVVGPKVLLGIDPERQRMDVADEQIDTIGRSFLGLTLGCARCHDHKFEPVPTADYYAMAGILTSTQVMEQRRMLGEQREMERLVGIGECGEALDASYEEFWRRHPEQTKRLERARSVLEKLEKDEAAGIAEIVETHPDALAGRAKREGSPMEEKISAQREVVGLLESLVANPPPIPPRAMVPADAAEPADEFVRRAGQFDQKAEQVRRGFLQVVSRGPGPEIAAGSSGRVALGEWLTDVGGGAGHLTARVMANRIWFHLVGQGLVKTVDNFGKSGEKPSHPELLDYLAAELIASGWSVKALVRQIVLSRAFAVGEADPATVAVAMELDPHNRLVWKGHRRRLDPEALRDAMLMAAGTLDLTPMDSTVSYLGDQATAVGSNEVRRRTDFPCRSVYLPVVRNDLPELFDAFDFANPHATTGERPQTMVPAQSLFLLNDEMVIAAAEATAKRLLSEEGEPSAERLFRHVLGVVPPAEECGQIAHFVETFQSQSPEGDVEQVALQAWSVACQALFASSRFQYLE